MGRATVISVAGLCLVALFPAKSRACECIGAGPACVAMRQSDVVFVGRVLAAGSTVQFQVERAVAGAAPGAVTLENGPGDCAFSFTVGERYVVYGHRNTATGALTTSICTRTRSLTDPRTRGDLAYFDRLPQTDSRGVLLTGVVRDITQDLSSTSYATRPLAGIEVVVSPVDGGATLRTRSRSDGSYEVTNVPPGRVEIRGNFPAQFEPQPQPTMTISQASRCAEADVYAETNGRIRGQLLGEDGRPGRGIDVQLADVNRARAQGQSLVRTLNAVTDEQGFFEFRKVGPGRYIVGVGLMSPPRPGKLDRRRFFNSTKDPVSATVVELGAAERRDIGTFSLAPTPAERVVTVVVTAPNGQFAPRIDLFLRGATREPIDQTSLPITVRLPFGALYVIEAVPPPGYRIVPAQNVRIDRDDTDRTLEFRVER